MTKFQSLGTPIGCRQNHRPFTVWFEDPIEAKALVDAGRPLVVAVAQKKPGSASSNDISGLFEVMPIKLVPSPYTPNLGRAGGIVCTILGACKEAEQSADRT